MLLYFSSVFKYRLIKTTDTLATFVVAYFLPGVQRDRKSAGFIPALKARFVFTALVLVGTSS